MISGVNNREVMKFVERSDKIMSAYKDMHRGRRCVIIGNGPSLRKMDLSFLRNEITFGLNRIFLGFKEWDFMPTYYVSVNRLVLQQNMEDILDIPVPKFLGLGGLSRIPDAENVIAVKTAGLPLGDVPVFSRDPREGMWEGFTVTYVAMQLAYYMGFSDVLLIGVDHHFSARGEANEEVVSRGDDQDHFHPGYFGRGIRWHLPDLHNSEVAYRAAKIAFEADGRRIIDATLDGKLGIFDKAYYREVFLEKRHYDKGRNEKSKPAVPYPADSPPDRILMSIDNALKAGDSDRALSMCIGLIKYDDSPELLNAQAELWFQIGDSGAAKTMLLKLIDAWPQYATAYNNLGVISLEEGDVKAALQYFTKALRISPSRETVINCGKLLTHLGNREDARSLFSKYLRRHPEDREIIRLSEAAGAPSGKAQEKSGLL